MRSRELATSTVREVSWQSMNHGAGIQKQTWVSLFVLVCTLVAIRAAMVPHWPIIWGDESQNAAHAVAVLESGIPRITLYNNYLNSSYRSFFISPGIAYGLAGWYWIWGVGYAETRFFYIVWYAVGILGAFACGRRAFGSDRWALLTALVAGADRVWIGRVASARPEGWQVAAVFWTIYALIRSGEGRSRRGILLWSFLTGAGCSLLATIWLTGLFIWPVVVVIWLFLPRDALAKKLRLQSGVAMAAGMFLTVLVYGFFIAPDPNLFKEHFMSSQAASSPKGGIFDLLQEQVELLWIFLPQGLVVVAALLGAVMTPRLQRDIWWKVGVPGLVGSFAILGVLSRMFYHRTLLVPFLVLLAMGALRMFSQMMVSKGRLMALVSRLAMVAIVGSALVTGLASQPVTVLIAGSAANGERQEWLSRHVPRGALVITGGDYYFAAQRAGATLVSPTYLSITGGYDARDVDYVFVEMDSRGQIEDREIRAQVQAARGELLATLSPGGRGLPNGLIRSLARPIVGDQAPEPNMGLWRIGARRQPSRIDWR